LKINKNNCLLEHRPGSSFPGISTQTTTSFTACLQNLLLSSSVTQDQVSIFCAIDTACQLVMFHVREMTLD